MTHPLCDLALYTWDEGRLHEALGLIQEYLVAFRQLRSPGGVAMALGYLSFMAASVGDFKTASWAVQEKWESDASWGVPINRAYGLHSIAVVQLLEGHLAQARISFEEALILAKDSQDNGFLADTHYRLAQVALYEDQLDDAEAQLADCRHRGGEATSTLLERQALLVRGQVAARRQDYTAAVALMRESLGQCQELRPQIPPRLEGLAQVYLGLNQGERGIILLGAAARQRAVMGCPVFPVDFSDYEQTLAGLRASVSTELFAAAWAAGEAMSTEESVAYALAA